MGVPTILRARADFRHTRQMKPWIPASQRIVTSPSKLERETWPLYSSEIHAAQLRQFQGRSQSRRKPMLIRRKLTKVAVLPPHTAVLAAIVVVPTTVLGSEIISPEPDASSMMEGTSPELACSGLFVVAADVCSSHAESPSMQSAEGHAARLYTLHGSCSPLVAQTAVPNIYKAGEHINCVRILRVNLVHD